MWGPENGLQQSLKETQVQPSKTQRIEEKGKVDGSSKLVAQSRKTNRFTFLSIEMAYRNNFSKKNILVESEVLVSDLSESIFVFIEDIFKKRQLDELNKEEPTPHVELGREFYTNHESFNLDDHSITFIIRGQTLEFSLIVVIKLYELP